MTGFGVQPIRTIHLKAQCIQKQKGSDKKPEPVGVRKRTDHRFEF